MIREECQGLGNSQLSTIIAWHHLRRDEHPWRKLVDEQGLSEVRKIAINHC